MVVFRDGAGEAGIAYNVGELAAAVDANFWIKSGFLPGILFGVRQSI
jgi:hypothetical protein